MLQVRDYDMFQTAYKQLSAPERSFVDRLMREIEDGLQKHGVNAGELLDTPIPDAIRARDTRNWLDRPLIRAAITEQLVQLELRQKITLDRIVREYHAIATFNLSDIMSFDTVTGEPTFDFDNATPEQMAAIKQIDVESGGSLHQATKTKIKVQTHDKIAALKALTDLLGGNDADNPYRQGKKTGNAPQITDDKTAQQMADEYQRMISDE